MTLDQFNFSFEECFKAVTSNPRVLEMAKKDFLPVSAEDVQWIHDQIRKGDRIDSEPVIGPLVFKETTDLCWHYKNEKGETETGGEFRFTATIGFTPDQSKTPFAALLTDYGIELYSQGFRFFEHHPHSGSGVVTALKVEKKKLLDEVYYVDLIHRELWKINLTYAEYIGHTVKLKGLYDWPYLFGDHHFGDLDFDMTPLERKLRDYPGLFPGSDVNEYLERYEERSG